MAAEVIALVSEKMGSNFKTKPARICYPNSHTPASSALEVEYYPNETSIANVIRSVVYA